MGSSKKDVVVQEDILGDIRIDEGEQHIAFTFALGEVIRPLRYERSNELLHKAVVSSNRTSLVLAVQMCEDCLPGLTHYRRFLLYPFFLLTGATMIRPPLRAPLTVPHKQAHCKYAHTHVHLPRRLHREYDEAGFRWTHC